ncbi:MAG: hypothetical protein GXO12_06825, partial [Epsilonproteobacteria bacterium]|nr:hypothetical protein [Campylobacterota bacterium]
MGIFSNNDSIEQDFSFVQKKIDNLKNLDIYITDKELEILNGDNIHKKIKTIFDIEERENFYWHEFKNKYPVALFAVLPNRKFIEWNKDFENLIGWSHNELKHIDSAAKVLWPINPKECKVCTKEKSC